MARTVTKTVPLRCDICRMSIRGEALRFVDGKTVFGPWADMCIPCHEGNGVGLGTGRGQLYEAASLDSLVATKVEG